MSPSKRSLLVFLLAASTLSAAEAPAKKKKLSLQDLISSGTPSRKPTTVAGVRGLDETSGEVDTAARDFAAIEKVELIVIHDHELNAFIEEGKLR